MLRTWRCLKSTTADLAAFLDAVQPVYETLEQNVELAAVIDEFRLVKQELGAPACNPAMRLTGALP